MLPRLAGTFSGQNSPVSPSVCRGRAKLSPPRRDPAAAGQFKIKNYPNFNEERKLWGCSYRLVVGLDEAGRGPLAGPVCAAAVCFFAKKQTAAAKLKIKNVPTSSRILDKIGKKLKNFENIKDSKKLSPKQREKWYEILTEHPDIKWSIGLVSEKIIDEINILQATKLAMKRALENLEIEPEYLLLDGNFSIRIARARPLASRNANAPMRMIPCKSIIKGDEKIISCAAASIIAKVTRDRIMVKYHKKYPQYGFDRHKGYGTKRHFAAIKKHGPCQIHRLSFAPFSQR